MILYQLRIVLISFIIPLKSFDFKRKEGDYERGSILGLYDCEGAGIKLFLARFPCTYCADVLAVYFFEMVLLPANHVEAIRLIEK